MSHQHKLTRRNFLGSVSMGCASLSLTPLYSGVTNLGLMNAAASANRSIYTGNDDYKALVCIFLSGGNDSFNMLVPKGQSEYNQYADVRGNIAHNRDDLLAINPSNANGKEFGIHPSMNKLQEMFNAGNAAFIANVGALVEPTNASNYKEVNLPSKLYSHSDQSRHWQTCVPQGGQSTGWGGRLGDILHGNNANQEISMNITLSGINTFQKGNLINEYSIGPNGTGSVTITDSDKDDLYNRIKRQTVDNLIDQNYHNILKTAYSGAMANSNVNAFGFASAIQNGQAFNTSFDNSFLSTRMQMVAKTIAAREMLDVKRQIFFVEMPGYDQHIDLINNQNNLLGELDNALGSFNAAMEELGLADDVVGFTMSDFGRKLTSNGNGTDHGWGGNAFLWGNAVNGNKIYGNYPELILGSNLDFQNGGLIPTTSCDEYFAELALWFGASSSDLDQIFPNIRNFWTPNAQGPLNMFI